MDFLLFAENAFDLELVMLEQSSTFSSFSSLSFSLSLSESREDRVSSKQSNLLSIVMQGSYWASEVPLPPPEPNSLTPFDLTLVHSPFYLFGFVAADYCSVGFVDFVESFHSCSDNHLHSDHLLHMHNI